MQVGDVGNSEFVWPFGPSLASGHRVLRRCTRYEFESPLLETLESQLTVGKR
jgi:hypothetical protein